LEDLSLEKLWVVYPGDEGYALHDRTSVLPVAGIAGLAAHWRAWSPACCSYTPSADSDLPNPWPVNTRRPSGSTAKSETNP